MKIYLQLLIIFGFSFIGNVISNVFRLPVPGSILGMILLFLALQFKILEFCHVDEAGSFLINNMTILFLPAGVGIMAKWNLISHFWAQILLIVVGALVINMLILGKLVEWIKVKFEGDYVALKPDTTVTSSTEDQ
ncbi:CidA/LrgA family protein [Lactococcus lactis]|uniref:CidA/LrgA family protein n=1 Tax=Lactococcus lactis TaxID=1358 RepID=UPI0006401E06|nr:CidA/LrgA family protein [Lactococcus lactis]KLK96171.1 membrane protein AbrB duplication [Lactococcus lactis subsp. lactis]MCT1171760.1 CidA/LrgA family protein [Lactococcus lactis]MDV4191810.1 CidA/LrgA family protein [Lactococcus lactis subsp. lactis]